MRRRDVFAAQFMRGVLPLISNVKEDFVWARIESRI